MSKRIAILALLLGISAGTRSQTQAVPEGKKLTPKISTVELKAKGQFPNAHIKVLKESGEFPGWANYVCFDPNPRLESNYFLLLAYSPKPVLPAAAKLGVIKGVTYQEYIGEDVLNPPPKFSDLQDEMAAKTAGHGISAPLFNMLNAVIQAKSNFKYTAIANRDALGDTFDVAVAMSGQVVWTVQKYTNATQAGSLFPQIGKEQFERDHLGFVLYEVSPGANLFRTFDPDSQTTIAEDLTMQSTNEGLFFTFSSYVKGLRTMPQHGRCEPIDK